MSHQVPVRAFPELVNSVRPSYGHGEVTQYLLICEGMCIPSITKHLESDLWINYRANLSDVTRVLVVPLGLDPSAICSSFRLYWRGETASHTLHFLLLLSVGVMQKRNRCIYVEWRKCILASR